MGLNLVTLLVTGCTSSGLALAVLFRAPDRVAHRIFAVNLLGVTLWTGLTYLLVFWAHDAATVTLLLRIIHPISALVIATYLDFVWVFPDRLQPAPRPHRVALYLSAVVFGAVGALPQLVQSVRFRPETPDVQFGWPLGVFGVYVLALMVLLDVTQVRKIRALHGIAHVQMVYCFIGTLGFQVFVFCTNVLLPLVTGQTAYARWGVEGHLFMSIAVTIAIAKHRLWDLSSLGQRAAAGALAAGGLVLTAMLLALCLGDAVRRMAITAPQGALLWLLAGIVLGMGARPVYCAFRGLLLPSLGEERDRISRLLSALGTAIVHAPPTDAALLPMLRQTRRYFGAESVAAYHRDSDGVYRSGGRAHAEGEEEEDGSALGEAASERLPERIVQGLGLDNLEEPLEVAELLRFGVGEEMVARVAAMNAMGASVAVPLRWQDESIGILAIGPKLSRDIYSAADVDLLGSVAAHAAIALKNAQLRAEMLAEQERTEKVLAQMESGVVAVDSLRVIQLVNPAARLLLGREEDDLAGQPLSALPQPLRELVELAFEEGRTVSGARAVLDEVAGLRVGCSTFILRGAGASVEGAGVVFRDLRTEDALQRVEQETERLRFIRVVSAGMAHEIRNPLVAIRTFAELAPTRLDDPDFRGTFLQVAHSEVLRLEELVSQFMTLAKPARHVREPTDVRALADAAVSSVLARAEAKGVEIKVAIPPELPQPRGDELRLHQALTNLLHNAVEAAPAGERVEVTARLEAGAGGAERAIVLTVWNSGSYIEPQHRERVFEPFFTTKPAGTGLGLAICHTIVDEHGGTTTVESDLEGGTAFSIHLPLVTAHDMAQVAMTGNARGEEGGPPVRIGPGSAPQRVA